MKILATILILGIFAQSQVEIVLTKSPSQTIYIGLENPIGIKNGKDFESYHLIADKVNIFKRKGKFVASASSTGTTTLYLYELNGKDSILVQQKTVTIKRVPDPTFSINKVNLLKHSISKASFLKANNIQVTLGIDYDGSENWFRIISYEMEISGKLFKVTGDLISTEIKKTIKKKNSKTEAIIKSVNAIGPDGFERQLEDLKFTIK